MADEITIEAKNLAPLIAKMNELHEKGIVLSGAWKNVGTRLQESIDLRYKYSGPNTAGEKFKGILVSSAYARPDTPASIKKRYAKIIAADRKSGNKTRLGVGDKNARPLTGTRGAYTTVELIPQTSTSGGGVCVRPTRGWAVYHHPTSFTGIGRGINADRGAHYVSNADADESVAIVDRVINKELSQTISGMQ